MSLDGTLNGVTRVFSHPQSLGQCNTWLLQNLPNAERVPLASNAEAARQAARQPGTCAIGPEIAAKRYGLKIVAPGIEDDTRNMTRFLVLGTQETRSTGRDRTSLAMTTPNQPGAVHALITPFAEYGVSMSQPRPWRAEPSFCTRVISATLSGRRMRTPSSVPRPRSIRQKRARSAAVRNSPAWPATPPIRRAVGS